MADQKKTAYLRARPGEVSALWVPDLGHYEVPDPSRSYTADDEIVKAHPRAFVPEDEAAQSLRDQQDARDSVQGQIMAGLTEPPVERATRAPGERRGTVKGKGE